MTPYYQDDAVTIYHGDCREVLPTLDKVDAVVTDPPYGIGAACGVGGDNKGKVLRTTDTWDDVAIDFPFLWQVLSMGQYACCFGGNYYQLPPSPSWLVWDKENTGNFADCELAWTNYGCAARIKRHRWNGMIRANNEQRNHPTQKPLNVILWAIGLCPQAPALILDPFMGSGTTLVAAKRLGRRAIGIELEEKYCEIAARRCGDMTRVDEDDEPLLAMMQGGDNA